MSDRNPLTPFLRKNGFLVLDGGLATELEARGYDLSDELWSARLLIDEPEAIIKVHTDYLRAGADCIITASYQATIDGFMKRGLLEEEAVGLLQFSIQLALDARDEFWNDLADRHHRQRPIVAASVGPYGAALADGSEYTGDYDLDEGGLVEFHRRRFHILSGTEADILACETIPSFQETLALAHLLTEIPGRYAWFSFSCIDGCHISDGTAIVDCAGRLDDLEQVAAVGINCTSPSFIPSLVREVRTVTKKPIVVYPNSGEGYDPQQKRWLGITGSADFATASKSWSAAGASLVGGCCRTGPDHIRQIRQSLISQ